MSTKPQSLVVGKILWEDKVSRTFLRNNVGYSFEEFFIIAWLTSKSSEISFIQDIQGILFFQRTQVVFVKYSLQRYKTNIQFSSIFEMPTSYFIVGGSE